jgi:hypothetical protein
MGGGGGKKQKRPQVEHPAPLDVEAIMKAGSEAAVKQIQEEYRQLIANYPTLENLSFGTVNRIRGLLNNQETQDAQSAVRRAMAFSRDEDADPTSIEQRLYDDTERDLALGRSLSPEQERAAQQSARGAFAARGLGTSMGSSAAEILNRDAVATQREAERRAAASQANNMMMGNVMNRRGMMADNLYAGAGNLLAVDPQNRALGIGLQSAQNQQGMMMNQIGSAFAGANQMAGNAASFNFNAQESRNNAALNNWASMRSAQMQAGAANNSATMGMIGTGVGAAVGIGVIAI